MKKIFLLSAAVLGILVTASCSKEYSGADSVTTIISASIAQSKTALGEKDGASWPNYWKAGDQISVNGVVSEALGAEADGKASADFSFEGALTAPYYAAYPAAALSDYETGSATLLFTPVQEYVEGSYDPMAFVMGGKSTDASLVVLSPCVSVFHLSLTGTASISKVRLTGADDAALSGTFTTDFETFTPVTAYNFVEMVTSAPVKLPAEFFICVPAGLSGTVKVEAFDTDGGFMSKTATLQSALTAGKMYSPAALAYTPSYGITITAEGITSSTAVICWDNAPEAAYTISVYADADCGTLVNSYAVPAGDDCWSGIAPRFCISGLDAGTTYYVKVINVGQSAESNVLPVTTAAFEIVEVTSTPAEQGDVILAEDFSELCWDCDMIGMGAGWFPTAEVQQYSFTTVDVDRYHAAETVGEKQLSSQTGPLAFSRLAHWAQGANPHMYIHPGYIKLVGSKKVTHLVTPALDNIPEGKIATLEVEVTVCRYYSESSDSWATDKAIIAVQPAGDYTDLVSGGTNKSLDLSSNIANITLPAETAWNTFTVTLNGVVKGDRLAFGAHKDIKENNARMNISDIKVTIKALNDFGDLIASAKEVSSSTATFTWTYGGSVDEDIAKPYRIALYSDENCENLVVSHEIGLKEIVEEEEVVGYEPNPCWSGKQPCFVFGGLNPDTEYWFQVEDTESGELSNPVSATTDAFTVVDATSVTGAAVGDVILAEDFSEIAWGSDDFAVAAGFMPSPKVMTVPSGVKPKGSFVKYDYVGDRIFGAGWDISGSRLDNGWGFFGNSSTYYQNGFLRVSSGSGRTHIVTPALSGIPAGKVATIEVTMTTCKYKSSTNDVAVFVEKGLKMNTTEDPNSPNHKKYTGASLEDGHVLGVTSVQEWETKSVTISGVDSDCQLVIGSLETGETRFYCSDIVVTIKALEEPGLVASLKSVSSSTATFSWTHEGASAAEDIAKPYTYALYRDVACTDLVVSFESTADAERWNGKSPCFVFGGLQPSTQYWFKVTDTENGKVSDPVSATTEAFTVVDATTVTDATVGDVILAEDFSEIGAGPDEIAKAAGFVPSSKVLPVVLSGNNPDGSFVRDLVGYDPYGDRIFGAGWDLGSSRLSKGWGFFGGSSCYYGAGYLRLATSSGRTHIVTPALSGIPAGKIATIEVTVTACKYESSTNDVAVFAEKDLTLNDTDDTSVNTFRKYTGASLSDGHGLGISSVKNWETKSVTISKVESDYHLLIGSLENAKNRCYISDVVVSIVSLKDKGAIDTHIEINDFATFKDFLTACEPGKTVQGDLMTDINLTASQLDEIAGLYPIAEFDGIVNGNNHTISGLTKPLFAQFTGTVSNLTLNSTLNITEAMNNVGILAQSAADATLTGCISKGSVTSSVSEVDGDLALGGLVGSISGCTLSVCQNHATVTNNTAASGTACVGGLIGVANGANTLTGTSSEYNYNQGLLVEDSATLDVAVGGICGYSDNAPSNFNYCKSLVPDSETDYDDIEIRNHTKNKVYVGGILGMSSVTSSLDYTYNASDIKFTSLAITQTGQVFGGGIIGGWTASGEQTITGCTNSGWVYTKDSAGDLAVADSEAKPKYWSCFAGIAGMGAGTSESLGSAWYTIAGKTFTNCSNSGTIRIYAALRCCIGGVVAYTENNPDGCVCTASDIRPYLAGGISQVGDNYHRNICGGVVGLCTASKVSNLKSTAKIVSQSSSPFAYTGGILGYVPAGTIELENCKVSNHVQAAGKNDGRSALMCHVAQNAVTVTFTNCFVKEGTLSYATGSKVSISSSNISAQHCVGSGSKYTIVNDVLPTVVDSID